MRLIDADVLMEVANTDGAYGYVDIKQIADVPTVNAVPVVRCRECKHKNHDSVGRPWCDMWEAQMFDLDGFCNYGERKEGVK